MRPPSLDATLPCNLCHDLSVQEAQACPLYAPQQWNMASKGALQVNFFGRAVLKKHTYTPAWCEVRRHHPWRVTAQHMTDLGIRGWGLGLHYLCSALWRRAGAPPAVPPSAATV